MALAKGNLNTLARPYARALFELARERKALAEWSETLALLAQAAAHPEMRIVFGSPKVTPAQLAEFFIAIGGKRLDETGKNFVRLLARNRRLVVLPQIAQLYEALRADAENRMDVELRAATKVGARQQQRIAAALKKRLRREVHLHPVVDESLIGGAMIRAGDLVIDDSVRGKLERLTRAIAR